MESVDLLLGDEICDPPWGPHHVVVWFHSSAADFGWNMRCSCGKEFLYSYADHHMGREAVCPKDKYGKR